MDDDIIFFDARGFVPSKRCKTIDDYLRESEKKSALIDRYVSDPHKFLKEMNGVDGDFSLQEISDTKQQYYFWRFMTKPLPAIVTKRKNEVLRVAHAKKPLHRIIDTVTFGCGGTIIPIRGDVRLAIPIVSEPASRSKLDNHIMHENIHCARHQLRMPLGPLTYNFAEETVAYSVDLEASNVKSMLRYFPAIASGFLVTPPAILYALLVKALPAVGAVIAHVGVQQYYGLRVANFYKKCEDENLNPNYLFLRTNPHEYSSRKTIKDNIRDSEKVKFQIIRTRLGL